MTGEHRFQLPPVLTQREAPQALRAMGLDDAGKGLPSTSPWTIDASALVEFDSSALAVLLAWKRAAAAAGVRLAVSNPPPKLVRLAGLYGLDEVLLEEAIAALEASPAGCIYCSSDQAQPSRATNALAAAGPQVPAA